MARLGARGAAGYIPPQTLVAAYRAGLFPMAMGRRGADIGWFSPDPRGILPLDGFHCPTRLARTASRGRFDITVDREFVAVIDACARRRETWISDVILASYVELHRLGLAHSVEARRDGRLVGGLYGVSLGGAFFGESMFHLEADASKVALVALVDRLRRRGYALLDVQWATSHLRQFGAIEVTRDAYLALLATSLERRCRFG